MTERELLTRVDAELAAAIAGLPAFVSTEKVSKARVAVGTLLAGILDRLEALEERNRNTITYVPQARD